jgi:hypothetical protein
MTTFLALARLGLGGGWEAGQEKGAVWAWRRPALGV